MNIGIIVYSQTGNTLDVCERLKERLIGEGHAAQIDRVTVVGERTPRTKTFELENQPTVSLYDGIVFASYVEAFSLCQVMDRYMKQIGALEGKQVACLVTQQFPYPWMGGSRAIGQLKKLCQASGASVQAAGVVNWAKSKREKTMAAAVELLSRAF